MSVLLSPPGARSPSASHRRWVAWRLVRALHERLAAPCTWASAAVEVRCGRRRLRPAAVVVHGDVPSDGVVQPAAVRLVIESADLGAGVAAGSLEGWHGAGVPVAWHLGAEEVTILDTQGPRHQPAPCWLTHPLLSRPLEWPLPEVGAASVSGRSGRSAPRRR